MKKLTLVNLPKKTFDIYISLVFKSGYHNEPENMFGYFHLLEHYFANQLQSVLKNKEVYGSIGDKDTQFGIKTTRKDVIRQARGLLETIFTPNLKDRNILEIEKSRILIELDEKYWEFHDWLEKETMKFVIASPNFIKRDRISQIKNIRHASLENLEHSHKKLMESPFVLFVAGYKLSEKQEKEIQRLTNDLPESKPAYERNLKATFSSKKEKILKKSIVGKDYLHQSLVFPGPSLKSNLVERFALGFICKELDRRLSYALGDIGIYKTNYQYMVKSEYGIVRFFSLIPKSASQTHEEIFFRELDEVASDSSDKLKEFIKNKSNELRKMWKGNLSYLDWIIDDFIDFGHTLKLKEVDKSLKKVDKKIVKDVARKIFSPSKVYKIIVSSVV